uniref:Fibronectin type-II domain-containing protein n=1 Tax=Varanus komodoensis TaxID=61221 RepID=A0A8D2J2Z5_VARKO
MQKKLPTSISWLDKELCIPADGIHVIPHPEPTVGAAHITFYGFLLPLPHSSFPDSASCIFPFVFDGKSYSSCTRDGKSGFWCATTRNYDKDLKWSYCGPCVFPFIYNLTSYSSCTTDGISNMRPWCSLTENYDADLQWTYCEPSGRRNMREHGISWAVRGSVPCRTMFITAEC